MVIRLSGFHTRYRFQRLSLTWTMLTSGLDGLMSNKRMEYFRIQPRLTRLHAHPEMNPA